MAKKTKTYVLMLSRVFPKSHPRADEPTGFKAKKEEGVKKHTIRGNAELWEHRAEEINAGRAVLSVRQWSGKPHEPGSHQIEIARHSHLGIQRIMMRFEYDRDFGMHFPVGGKVLANDSHQDMSGDVWKDIPLEVLAANDGLSSEDFKSWFATKGHTRRFSEERVILHFTDMHY